MLDQAVALERQVLVTELLGEVPLRVEVDHADLEAHLGQCLGDAGGQGSLADPALLVADRDPAGPGCSPLAPGSGCESSQSRIDCARAWL